MSRRSSSVKVLKVGGGKRATVFDSIAGEYPLEVRVQTSNGEPIVVTTTMRTPGSDFELAVGTLVTAGIIDGSSVLKVQYCTDLASQDQTYNVVTVVVRDTLLRTPERPYGPKTSSCGICGSSEIDRLLDDTPDIGDTVRIADHELLELPALLRSQQTLFSSTGGLHAVGLYRDGQMLAVCEDIGRHNAFDKAIGKLALAHKSTTSTVSILSGRVGFEMVQKAAAIGSEIIAAVSAPSSLAVESCQRLGITLAGFIRDGSANIYTHPQRIT